MLELIDLKRYHQKRFEWNIAIATYTAKMKKTYFCFLIFTEYFDSAVDDYR